MNIWQYSEAYQPTSSIPKHQVYNWLLDASFANVDRQLRQRPKK